jgi:hypothetical protein
VYFFQIIIISEKSHLFIESPINLVVTPHLNKKLLFTGKKNKKTNNYIGDFH